MDRKTAIEQALIKQFNALMDAHDAAYVTVIAVLAALPVPMLMPAPEADITLRAKSLDRAWEMAAEEPLLPMTIDRIRAMISAYFQAWEVAYVVGVKGPASWRLRAIEDSLNRIDESEAVILRHLACDFRPERLTDEQVAEIDRIVAEHGRKR